MRSLGFDVTACWLLLLTNFAVTDSFGVAPDLLLSQHAIIADTTTLLPSLLPSTLLATAADVDSSFSLSATSLYAQYQTALQTDPVVTKMVTGAVLAVVGDGIAQGCIMAAEPEECLIYDEKRAVAFSIFDASYRYVQHILYPPMILQFQGNYIGNLFAAATHADPPTWAAALEQSLVSQLVIIPLIYYPSFFAITGAVQGLTVEETIERAKTTFVPLMKRNLLFWIPVQFLVFEVLASRQELQIPILSLCGLVWTVILSFVAGSVAPSPQQPTEPLVLAAIGEGNTAASMMVEEEDVYCVTGMEVNCEIDPDNLFRPPSRKYQQSTVNATTSVPELEGPVEVK